MNKIHERYINQAKRIREQYIKNMQLILLKDKIIDKYKTNIKNIMISNKKYIDSNSDKNLNMIKNSLKEKLLEIESNINNISKELIPLIEKNEKLEKESTELFITIKDKYPDLSKEDIQKEILFSIKR
jgi:hypothetical protein